MQKAVEPKFKKTKEKGIDGPSARIERREEKQKPVFAENRSLAARVAAVAVAVVILVMGPVKLKALKTEARDVFRNGTSTKYVTSVYNDIRSSADNAVTLAGLAETVLGSGDKDAGKLRSLAAAIRDSEDEEKLLKAFSELKPVTEDIFTRLQNAGADEITMNQALGSYKNIKSAFTTVGNDQYFAYARRFNEERSGFPARLMALVGGIGELPVNY